MEVGGELGNRQVDKEEVDCNSKGIRNYGQQYIVKSFIDIQSSISENYSSDMLPSSYLCVIRGPPKDTACLLL